MRISNHIFSVALLSLGLGCGAAYALDGTPSPAKIIKPQGGVGSETGPGLGSTSNGNLIGGSDSLKAWMRFMRDGNPEAARRSLEDGARNGDVMATWKLGRIYADGDGVKQNDLAAFERFRGIADGHADDAPGTAQARFVANAFVALGGYYLTGIANSNVKTDFVRAREMFSYAASYFADSDAQYHLGRMYLDGQGIGKDPKQATRWLSLAAGKGQYQAQAVFGAMLFKGQSVPRDAARGLMWLTLAKDAATPQETWITDLYNAAMKQATEEERSVALVHLARWMERVHNKSSSP
jgi:TPR repeat protein